MEQHLAIFGRGPQPEFTKDMLYTTGLEILSSFRKYISFFWVFSTKCAALVNTKQGRKCLRVSNKQLIFYYIGILNHLNPFIIIKNVIFHKYTHGPTNTRNKLRNKYQEMSFLPFTESSRIVKISYLGVGLRKVFCMSLLRTKHAIGCFPVLLKHVRSKVHFKFLRYLNQWPSNRRKRRRKTGPAKIREIAENDRFYSFYGRIWHFFHFSSLHYRFFGTGNSNMHLKMLYDEYLTFNLTFLPTPKKEKKVDTHSIVRIYQDYQINCFNIL